MARASAWLRAQIDRVAGSQPTDRAPAWWTAHRDAVLYTTTGLVVAVLGLLWNGTLSMILTPIWMLIGVWFVPALIERRLGWRR